MAEKKKLPQKSEINKSYRLLMAGTITIIAVPVIVIIFLLFEVFNAQQDLSKQKKQQMESISNHVIMQVSQNHQTGTVYIDWEELIQNLPVANNEAGYHWLVFDERNVNIFRSSCLPQELLNAAELINLEGPEGLREWKPAGEWIVVEEQVDRNGGPAYYLILASQESLFSQYVTRIQVVSVVGLILIGIIASKIVFKLADEMISKYADISERYKKVDYEDRFKEHLISQKMVTMENFAAGIAHEIGNPLSSILSTIQILTGYELDEDETRNQYNQLMKDSRKIDRILHEILDYRRYNNEANIKVNLNDIISDSVGSIEAECATKNIEFALELSPNIPELILNEPQLRIVFLNIIRNACQAINEQGYVYIRTIVYDNVVRVRIADSGSGIKPEHMDNIFDPFFTTKDVGKGMGMGLYASFQIIHAHKGSISAESNYGEGTIFTVDFPFVEE
ncbi:MAG: hypothetical protein D5S00_06940 [Tindallia sp. MSAO_Bac2]|nr:MAG: hypothetical protein D5S00_06940 [Tindallia sp. MSAO_Bac2]